MILSSCEAHWRRWPGFRQRVAEARAFAGPWLESRPAEPVDFTAAAGELPPPTVAEALRMAIRHRRRGSGPPFL